MTKLILFLVDISSPDHLVGDVSNEEEDATQEATKCKEYDPLACRENLYDGIDPEARHVVNVVNPCKISEAEQSSDRGASPPGGEGVADQEELAQLERDDGGVHQVVEDGGEVLVQHCGEYQFPVHGPDTPEDDSNKHSDGKGSRGEHEVPDTVKTLGEVGQESDREEDELEEHVEEGEILPDPSETVPVATQPLRHLNPVDLVVHGPGEAGDATELEGEGGEAPDHVPGEKF